MEREQKIQATYQHLEELGYFGGSLYEENEDYITLTFRACWEIY